LSINIHKALVIVYLCVHFTLFLLRYIYIRSVSQYKYDSVNERTQEISK